MAKPKPAPLPAGSAVGEYRVVRALASGGSSVVYLATSDAGQSVLLKEYLPGALVHRLAGDLLPLVRPGRLDRLRVGLHGFLDGARLLARLQHPTLATVLDCVQAHETVYLVLRHLEGRTLQELIVSARVRGAPGCLSEAVVVGMALDLLQALAIVHEAGLLHLDVKPANLLLTAAGQLVLLDFDAVQPIPAGDHSGVRPAFTPGFSAPETMAHPAALGPWTDLYAVGACLYACMTGHPPPHCLGRAQDDSVPATLQALQGVYSDELLGVVEKSMSLGMGRRAQSVQEMRRWLWPAAQSAAARESP